MYKTWFDQPAKKAKRRAIREKKASKLFPMPLKKLRPIVRCPTVIHNIKQRLGRGFTPEECKSAGLDYHYARTIGISVDLRRRNMNKETFDQNVERLKTYQSKIKIYKNASEAKKADVRQHKTNIMPLKKPSKLVRVIKVSDIQKDFPAN